MNHVSLTDPPTLHLLCGKIASGKSTLSARLAADSGTIVIAEDTWLAALFAEEMHSVADYVRCSAKLKMVMKPHLISLLRAGVSVVLDFPANTVTNREWMKSIIRDSAANHCLHYLKVADEVCKSRLRARNEAAAHDFSATDEQFDLITRYFQEPGADEGFNIVEYA
ncbi:ATP-binding protein [Serratia sp. M24T3]|uniref:AAA family ATPase n=1 Tax=Serratia sp. M24T3 TaxID=932213 RepID=UPI00025BA2F5|nr:ATP-binding protein [Serratia sp. M24T3]EIC85242.1 hypothetical protein SPM24T3_07374 [Serratia sp. M24T3]